MNNTNLRQVGGPEHVDEQIVRQDLQLLDLLPLHSKHSEHQVTEQEVPHLHIHLPPFPLTAV